MLIYSVPKEKKNVAFEFYKLSNKIFSDSDFSFVYMKIPLFVPHFFCKYNWSCDMFLSHSFGSDNGLSPKQRFLNVLSLSPCEINVRK